MLQNTVSQTRKYWMSELEHVGESDGYGYVSVGNAGLSNVAKYCFTNKKILDTRKYSMVMWVLANAFE